MAIISSIAGAIAGALFTAGSVAFMVAKTLIGGVLAFGARLALSYVSRPKKRAYSAVQGEFRYGASVPAGAMYGTGKVRGHEIFYARWGPGDRFNASVYVLSDGWCDGLEPEIFFYGKTHALVPRDPVGEETEHWGVEGFGSLISIRFYDGRPGQPADAKLVADTAALGQSWKSTSVVAGHAYVVFEAQWDAALFDRGFVEPEFVLRGLRLYDPTMDSTLAGGEGDHRLDDASTWEFSESPALQHFNYRLGIRAPLSGRARIGEGKTPGQLDLGSYIASINACATQRGGKPIYQAALYVNGEDDHTEILAELEDAMAGYRLNRRGLSGVIAGAPQIPVATITDADLDAGRKAEISWRRASDETFNHLAGQFISKASGWKPESLKTIRVNADVAEDGGRIRQERNDFLQVTDPDAGQYVLSIRYRQNRLGGRASLPVSRLLGLAIEEGRWVSYAGQDWLVTGWSIDGRLRISVELAQTSAAIYDDGEIEPGPLLPVPAVPVNPAVLTTVQGFNVEVGVLQGDDGYETPVLRFTWTPPEDPTITAVRFEYFQGADPTGQTFYYDQTPDVEAGVYVTSKDVAPGAFYTARATITTVPDRLKTHTPWVTTLQRTARAGIPVYLDDLKGGIYPTIVKLRADLEDLRMSNRELALAVAQGHSRFAVEHKRLVENERGMALAFIAYDARITEIDDALVSQSELLLGVAASLSAIEGDIDALGATVAGQAGAISALGASVTALEDEVTALAAQIVQLNAEVGEISADGLWKIEVQAGTGDVVARAVIMMRATVGDDFVEVGTIWEAGFTGGDPDQPFARQINIADQWIVSDGTNEGRPMVFEDGELKLAVARIANAIVELLQSETGKTRFGTLAALVEGLEVLS